MGSRTLTLAVILSAVFAGCWGETERDPAVGEDPCAVFEEKAACCGRIECVWLGPQSDVGPGCVTPKHCGAHASCGPGRCIELWYGGLQYLDELDQAPWKLTFGSFRGTFPDTAGFPNLFNPRLTWFGQALPYTYWAGQQSKTAPFTPVIQEQEKSRYEVNSTLFGGVCKLLVTGGPNPVLDETVKETTGSVQSLVPGNLPLSAERAGQLLVETFTTAQQYPQTFHGLIDLLAMGAGQLAQSHWLTPKALTAEKVRLAFGEYGFGRGGEGKAPHGDKEIVDTQKAENVIATGLNYYREITGTICCAEEDFFVLNEEARNGDSVEYEINVPAAVQVRLYDEAPCSFDEPEVIKGCARDHQFYPPVSAPNYDTPPTFFSNGAKVLFPTKLDSKRPVYVGLRLVQPPTTSGAVSYTLTVNIVRNSGSVYP